MAVYLVGADNKSLFKKRTTWDFMPALEAASAGDILEIQAGFTFAPVENSGNITIEKDLTIKGQVIAGQSLPHIQGGIFIKNGAKVKLQNLLLSRNIEKSNVLNVSEEAAVVAENVNLANTATTGTNYPIVYIKEQASLVFEQVNVEANQILDGKHRIYLEDSNAVITNSSLNTSVVVHSSELNCQNTTINYLESNALLINADSKVKLSYSKLQGGKLTKETNYPCVYCEQSQLTSTKNIIAQPNYNKALLAKNSTVQLTEEKIDSADFSNCEVTVDKTVFVESLALNEGTQLSATAFSILGKANGKVNLYADERSAITAKALNFGLLTMPNIKLNRNVHFEVSKLNVFQYDPANEWFALGPDGKLTAADNEMKIEYFGDKTSYEKLNEMIGLSSVKAEIKEFIALAQMNKARAKKGLATSALTLHSMFLGNPGTGKTTVARIVGSLLYEKGIISSDNFVETSRSDLVGEYIGATAIKTREVLESALGGVLFIDEAYTLANGGEKDYGLEAINEILKFMEDNRENIVIIFAGYTDEMTKFLAMNEGLKSRVPNVFHFEDYTPDELTTIGLAELHAQSYQVDEADYSALVHHNFEMTNDFSNGRWVRNLNERIIRKLALRLYEDESSDMSVITKADLQAVQL